MPTSELISTAKTTADLDRAYASALKALSKLGIKMTVKKLDVKISTAMTKSQKPAEFRLLGDRGVIKMEVATKDFSSVLGLLDTNAERDAEKRLIIIKSLVEAGLLTAADLKAAQAEAVPSVDPTVLKNYLKRLSDLKAQESNFSKLTLNAILGNPALLKQFSKAVASAHASENLDFILALSKKVAPQKIIDEFVKEDAPQQVNLSGPERQAALDGNFKLAVQGIMKLVDENNVTPFKKSLSDAIKGQIAAHKLVGKKAGIPADQLG